MSSVAFDQQILEAMRLWLGESNQSMYALGPLVPPGFIGTGLSDVAKQSDIASSDNGEECKSFLDEMLKSHGKHSVIYVHYART